MKEDKKYAFKKNVCKMHKRIKVSTKATQDELEIPEKIGIGEYIEIMHKDIEKLLKHSSFEIVYNRIFGDFSSYWINI
jgi:16S rRNA pseudouridine516 synthase